MMTNEKIKNAIKSLIDLQHVRHSSLEECQETFSLIREYQFFLSHLKINVLEDKCWFANNLMEKVFKNVDLSKIKKCKHSNILEDEEATSSLKCILDVLFAKVQDKTKIDDNLLLYSAFTSFYSKDLVLEFFLKETQYMLSVSLPFPNSISILSNHTRLSSQIRLGVSQVALHNISYDNNVDIDFNLKFLQDLLASYIETCDLDSLLKPLEIKQLEEIEYEDEEF